MNTTIRRIASMMIAVLLALTLAACGKAPAESTAPEESAAPDKKPEMVDPKELRPVRPDEPTAPETEAVRLGDMIPALDDVKSVTVFVNMPGTTVELGERERGKILELLRMVELRQRDDSFSESDGQYVEYTVELQSGEKHAFVFCSPFVIVDGVGYRSDCDAGTVLTEFGKSLIPGE